MQMKYRQIIQMAYVIQMTLIEVDVDDVNDGCDVYEVDVDDVDDENDECDKM